MLHVQDSSKAQTYRRKAAMCDHYAACARTGADREQLLRMRDGWSSRAAREDGRDGLPPTPPSKPLALAVP